ncbi:MAG: hypothetical protein QM811_13625 [Pirellulales bacterium]
MSAHLDSLRSNLLALASKRRGLRWGTGWFGFGLALLAIFAAFFVVDYALSMTVLQRIVAWVVVVIAVVWAAKRYLAPYLGRSESAQEMALWVERQQQIDSDLIAALQFEDETAAGKVVGSPALRGAVVDYVAEFSQGLNVFAGLDRGEFTQRAAWLAGALLLAVALGVLFPAYALAFFERIALAKTRYPTNVGIERVWVNGVEYAPDQLENATLRIAYGRPVLFEAKVAGQENVASSQSKVVLGDDAGTRDLPLAFAQGKYSVELPQIFDATEFTFRIGDARSDVGRITVMPLPVVELRLTPHSPEYVLSGAKETAVDPGTRQITVVEGSSVDVSLASANKPLKSVTLSTVAAGKQDDALVATDPERKTWVIPAVSAGPLAEIKEAVKFELRIVDEDDLSLPTPIEGLVRVKPDRPPSSTMTAKVKLCVPTATPVLEIRATDDYGLSAVRLRVEPVVDVGQTLTGAATSESGFGATTPATSSTAPPTSAVRKTFEPIVVKKFDPPLRGQAKMPFAVSYKLDLAPYGLKRGDHVKLKLEVVDDRGAKPGVATLGDELDIEISDVSGVIAASSEFDTQADRKLESILKVQTGGGP